MCDTGRVCYGMGVIRDGCDTRWVRTRVWTVVRTEDGGERDGVWTGVDGGEDGRWRGARRGVDGGGRW